MELSLPTTAHLQPVNFGRQTNEYPAYPVNAAPVYMKQDDNPPAYSALNPYHDPNQQQQHPYYDPNQQQQHPYHNDKMNLLK